MSPVSVIADRYRVEGRLGVGGMSTVLLAIDERLERHVAVKLLAEHLADDPTFVSRFRREALAAARLVHPNIVQVFDSGFDQSAHQHFIVMEYVPGQSCARRSCATAVISTSIRPSTSSPRRVAGSTTRTATASSIAMDVYPECDGQSDEIACDAKKLDEANKSKVKAQIFTHLLYRHWNAYKEGKRSHIFIDPIFEIPPAGGSVGDHPASIPRDLTPGDYDAPVFSLGGQDDYAFSPDGQEICYTSNHDKNPAASTNNDLWIVPVNGGPAKNITADNPASDSTPLYSPDGRYIAYRAQQRPGYESDRFRLMLYDRKTGEKKNLTRRFRRWVGSFIWSPNSQRIYFSMRMKVSLRFIRSD